MKMKATMLGSGCWEGIPAPFCDCRICRMATNDTKSVENRTRPELYVHTDETDILFEISPDIRSQSTQFGIPKILHFVISHWHFDHMFGLYELHAWIELILKEPMMIYCSKATAKVIEDQFGYIPVNINIIKAFEPFCIGNVAITPLPVYHMKRSDDDKTPENLDNTFGYLIESFGKKITYLSDYYRVPQKTIEYINNSDTIVLDGTYLLEEEYPNKSYQNAIRDEKDPDHLHGKDIINFASSLVAGKIVYHSIAHISELTNDEMQKKLPVGQYIGCDGYEL